MGGMDEGKERTMVDWWKWEGNAGKVDYLKMEAAMFIPIDNRLSRWNMESCPFGCVWPHPGSGGQGQTEQWNWGGELK